MALGGSHSSRNWTPPDRDENDPSSSSNQLLLYNSFTDRKEVFTPHQSSKDSSGRRKIKWYSCGPTVYDSAHLGHSRNYMTIDILRRVLEDYFDFDVTFVMNITDVDDKIVLRARRNHLLQQYQRDMTTPSQRGTSPGAAIKQVAKDASQAVQQSLSKQQQACNDVRAELDSLQKQPSHEEEPNGTMHSGEQHRKEKRISKKAEEVTNTLREEEYKLDRLSKARQHLQGLAQPQSPTEEDVGPFVKEVMNIAGDEIALWQDGLKGASVTDPGIYKRHAERYEAEFWEDMKRLGMRIPEEENLTRVTEYMEEIISYIEQIMDNGFAYTQAASGTSGDNRSVYFDTQAYIKSGHSYPKLSPWAGGSAALSAAGESNFTSSEKRSGRDFALWKASKAGEPSWPSPWGQGRPGWHIECSAMASKLLGQKMDIHTGGVDLRFPHHDNELAQAEAHYHRECGCGGQWVNYFLHSGHLNINGLKMSKSLKNFYTIREILDHSFSATQLRLMFAMQPWNKEMNFVFSAKQALQKKESTFKHFFNNVGMLLPKGAPQDSETSGKGRFDSAARAELLDMSKLDLSQSSDKDLADAISHAAAQVHSSLLDNVNTGAAVEALLELVAVANKYMKQREEASSTSSSDGPPNAELLKMAAGYVEAVLRVLGIVTIGLHLSDSLEASSQQLLSVLQDFRNSIASEPKLQEVCSSVDLEDPAMKERQPAEILDELTSFRARVRAAAKKAKAWQALEECDRIRDDVMVELGVRMEDKADGSSVWMADDAETLREERRERVERAQQEALIKARKGVDAKRALLEKVERQAQQPTVQEALRDDYSRFTTDGQDANPTHDKDGNELTGGALKKGKSKADGARKQRAFYEKQVSEKGADYLDKLQAEVAQAVREFEELEKKLERLSTADNGQTLNGGRECNA